jgi:hypothetical protein
MLPPVVYFRSPITVHLNTDTHLSNVSAVDIPTRLEAFEEFSLCNETVFAYIEKPRIWNPRFITEVKR